MLWVHKCQNARGLRAFKTAFIGPPQPDQMFFSMNETSCERGAAPIC